MTSRRYEDWEKKVLLRVRAREKKKQMMPVSGKGVFQLQKLIGRSKFKKNNSK